MEEISAKEALEYHAKKPHGKIEIRSTKPMDTQRDLSLAYSPGVAEPCLEIAKNPSSVYEYTAKGNLVGVISNGTSVLGLGNIGADASKPVMEGKGVLFKKLAGIDVFDIEINESNPEKFIDIVASLEPTFGGINLEDIKAPECFIIERELKRRMKIPVMHDDQHGTAIITAAALINALEVVGKKIEDINIVVNGAGSAAISCTDLYVRMGANREKIVMLDSKGVIRRDSKGLSEEKKPFATKRNLNSLAEAIKDADVFLGLSRKDILSADLLKQMRKDPIVFALANPYPEIDYHLAHATRNDLVMATGRSDHPNQVNNVLVFPYLFRGALDSRASEINEEMKLAAVQGIADLAKEKVPQDVLDAYNISHLTFGKDYLIPKPNDKRLITSISTLVAQMAVKTGVARKKISDWEAYRQELTQLMEKT